MQLSKKISSRKFHCNNSYCESILIFSFSKYSLLCDLGYRTLTHPSIKERRIIEAAFQIFGLAIKQYNQPMVFSVRIVQILESEEVSVVPVARGIQFLQESFGITTVLAIIMKELIEKLNVPNPSAATAKHVSMFLTEITEISSDMSVEVLQNNSPELLDLEVSGFTIESIDTELK